MSSIIYPPPSLLIDPNGTSLLAGVPKSKRQRVVFFCDESGRTGANFLDHDQPFHVFAGYPVGESKWRALSGAVQQVRAKRGGGEVKGATLTATKGGLRLLSDFILAADRDLIPVMVVLEKRYFMAQRLHHLLVDPRFNHRDSGSREARDRDCEVIADLPDETLQLFQDFYGAPTHERLAVLVDRLSSELTGRRHFELATRLAESRARAADLVEHQLKYVAGLDIEDALGRYRVGATIDLDAFFLALRTFDRMLSGLRDLGHAISSEVEVAMDEVRGAQAFGAYFEALRSRGELRNLVSLRTGASHANLGVQAADYLAAATRYVVERPTVPKEFALARERLLFQMFSSPPKVFLIARKRIADRMKVAPAEAMRLTEPRRRILGLVRGRSGQLPAG